MSSLQRFDVSIILKASSFALRTFLLVLLLLESSFCRLFELHLGLDEGVLRRDVRRVNENKDDVQSASVK